MEQRTVPTGKTEPENAEGHEGEASEIVYVGYRRAYTRRLGCGCIVLLWSLILLIPGFLLLLAVQGEIVVWHGGNVPESASHPLAQIKLLMEVETRGLNIMTSTPITKSDTQTCMQTDVRFVLWQGKGNNVTYCDCYEHEVNSKSWTLVSTANGACDQG